MKTIIDGLFNKHISQLQQSHQNEIARFTSEFQLLNQKLREIKDIDIEENQYSEGVKSFIDQLLSFEKAHLGAIIEAFQSQMKIFEFKKAKAEQGDSSSSSEDDYPKMMKDISELDEKIATLREHITDLITDFSYSIDN